MAAAAARRLELVHLKADLLDRLGVYFGELQQQRQAEMGLMTKTAAEVGALVNPCSKIEFTWLQLAHRGCKGCGFGT